MISPTEKAMRRMARDAAPPGTLSDEIYAFERSARALINMKVPCPVDEGEDYARGMANGYHIAVLRLLERARAIREMLERCLPARAG